MFTEIKKKKQRISENRWFKTSYNFEKENTILRQETQEKNNETEKLKELIESYKLNENNFNNENSILREEIKKFKDLTENLKLQQDQNNSDLNLIKLLFWVTRLFIFCVCHCLISFLSCKHIFEIIHSITSKCFLSVAG